MPEKINTERMIKKELLSEIHGLNANLSRSLFVSQRSLLFSQIIIVFIIKRNYNFDMKWDL